MSERMMCTSGLCVDEHLGGGADANLSSAHHLVQQVVVHVAVAAGIVRPAIHLRQHREQVLGMIKKEWKIVSKKSNMVCDGTVQCKSNISNTTCDDVN